MKFGVVILLCGMLFWSSCEDPIDVDSGFQNRQLVVDAWLNNRNEPQTIKLSWSQDYFDNSRPEGVSGALVRVSSASNNYQFLQGEPGMYTWTPQGSQTLGEIGDQFDLEIQYEGEVIAANTELYRVPEIDSIALVFEEESIAWDGGLYGELFADDFPGTGDTYLVRTWKNDTLLNRPQELTILYDGTFDGGSGLDGGTFLLPLRRQITPFNDDFEQIPYESGDHIYCELHSISNEAFRFLQIAQEQMINGDNTIFALPLANARGNIVNLTTGNDVFGVFNIAAISSSEQSVE